MMVLCFWLGVLTSNAQEQGLNFSGWVGLDVVSLNITGTTASSSSLSYGGRVGYQIHPRFELGASVTSMALSLSSSGVSLTALGLSAHQTFLTADLTYYFTGVLRALYCGARVGVGILSASAVGFAATEFAALTGVTAGSLTALALGVVTGYQFVWEHGLSVGPQVSLLYEPALAASSALSLIDFQAQAVVRVSL